MLVEVTQAREEVSGGRQQTLLSLVPHQKSSLHALRLINLNQPTIIILTNLLHKK